MTKPGRLVKDGKIKSLEEIYLLTLKGEIKDAKCLKIKAVYEAIPKCTIE